MSIRQGSKVIAGNFSYSPDLFDHKWADHILNDPQWLRADTFAWQSGNTYAAAYNHLVGDVDFSSGGGWNVVADSNVGGGNWLKLIYANNQYMSFSDLGAFCKSSDGTNWTLSTPLPIGGSITSTWGGFGIYNTTLFAINTCGMVATSSNYGTSWSTSSVSNLSNGSWQDLAWNGSKFVAIGSTGMISTSTNGTSWTAKTTVSNLGNNKWIGITYGNSKFVAISLYGYVSTSTDGTTWTAATQPANLVDKAWEDIIWDGTRFIALSRYGYMYSSTNGTTWTEYVEQSVLGSHGWKVIGYHGSNYVALSCNGADCNYAIYSPLSLSTETIAGTTISYYRAADGHKICLANQESNVTAIYNSTGVAWYYIIDTTNQRFKLPRTKYSFIGLTDTVGNYVEPGLPNITGSFKNDGNKNNNSGLVWGTSGAFSATSQSTIAVYTPSSTATVSTAKISFDASTSNSIYGNSTTVQPPATQMYLYFYVGNFTQPAILNTVGVTTETVNSLSAHAVIEFQAPTSSNNYTWYRKYADGWVEQGGITTSGSVLQSVVLPITMADTNYTIQLTGASNDSSSLNNVIIVGYENISIAGFDCRANIVNKNSQTSTNTNARRWLVAGMAA